MRKKIAALTKGKASVFKWRSHEPSRLETFSDAVFAFVITLIMVSLEVPRTFDELFEVFKGFFSFACCFGILFMIWNSQNIYFRRYGLNNAYVTFLNALLLFVVLMYVYPLKFLFSALFSDGQYNDHGHTGVMITQEQQPTLMYVYHSGYAAIYTLFFFMYLHAKKSAREIKLSPAEEFETNTYIILNLCNAGLGIAGILFVLIAPVEYKGTSGFIYMSIPFLYSILFGYRGRKAREKFGDIKQQPA
ncbi:DUF1211 domain-containing protein [Mucilaginibacter sp. BJC16-A38]|uniref:TMEM175 family protein n=1 Tax=Mucilaginibacter phenanthrenivorans TaxID=1234842 RepID=UPI0021586CF9|nr:TMEM175 family protein [Mucilaginibacter phenanthrenivorans]MCR8558249.1 DUF1211 domain-containing protein [Mucilaginibacter phenanthrenivorans]